MRAPASLWRSRDVLHLWAGASVSEVGSQVTVLALPLLAVTTLHATTLHATTFEVATPSRHRRRGWSAPSWPSARSAAWPARP